MHPLPRQLIPVRPVHLEAPTAYLRRVCLAQGIDHGWMRGALAQRQQGLPRGNNQLGVVIEELTGRPVYHFEQSHAFAGTGYPNARSPWEKQSENRIACLSCTAGIEVATYPHIRFSFCRRHGRWLGTVQRGLQRAHALDAETWKAERTLRNLVTVGHVDRDLYETTWELLRDNTWMMGEEQWTPRFRHAIEQPDFTRETDDRIALLPHLARVLSLVATPEFAARVSNPAVSGERDGSRRRSFLYRQLDWIGTDRWVLVEGLDAFFNRESERVA